MIVAVVDTRAESGPVFYSTTGPVGHSSPQGRREGGADWSSPFLGGNFIRFLYKGLGEK